MKKLGTTTPLTADLGLLVVRLWFGSVLAVSHGYGKVLDLGSWSDKVAGMGMPVPSLLGPAAALAEFAGGLLIAVGLATRPAALTIVSTMLVAAFVRHADDPFIKKEFALCYGAAALAVLVAGAGRFSLDALLRRR